MEITLRPPFHGCLIAMISLATLGLYPLLRRMAERRFIARMDDAGVELRSGRRMAWGDFTSIERVTASMHGAQLSDEYVLRGPAGRASLPLWRAGNAAEARDYLLRRLPPGIAGR
ncbi:MAG: hypothetical protein IT557_08620 [Alphaproteobacteria bacterium]|nr:hypothetical protein [Alphaproteobacteria bacterium]